MISNSTCCRCQNCDEWTNHADDPHFKALVQREATLRAALVGMVGGSTLAELAQIELGLTVITVPEESAAIMQEAIDALKLTAEV